MQRSLTKALEKCTFLFEWKCNNKHQPLFWSISKLAQVVCFTITSLWQAYCKSLSWFLIAGCKIFTRIKFFVAKCLLSFLHKLKNNPQCKMLASQWQSMQLLRILEYLTACDTHSKRHTLHSSGSIHRPLALYLVKQNTETKKMGSVPTVSSLVMNLNACCILYKLILKYEWE